MFKNNLLLLAVGGCLGLPLHAGTITINTFPDGPPDYTIGYIFAAQTFTAPSASVDILSSFEFEMYSAIGQTAQLDIYAWGSAGPTGPVLFQSLVLDRTNTIGQTFNIPNIDLTLTPGSLYGAVIDPAGYSDQDTAFNLNQNSYSGGAMWLVSDAGPAVWTSYAGQYDLTFSATFSDTNGSSTPEPGAFYLLGGGLGALVFFRRRRSSRL